jgi:hypothetical protein
MDDVINLKDRRVIEAHKKVDEERELIDYDVPEGEELDLAIQIGIEKGEINLAKLTRVVMNLNAAIDAQADFLKKLAMALKIEVDQEDMEALSENAILGKE